MAICKFFIVTVLLSTVFLNASEKYYEVENGLVVYENNTTLKIGNSNSIKTVAFKSWGDIELIDELGTFEMKGTSFSFHNMTKRAGENFYTVNFEQKRINTFVLPKYKPLLPIKSDSIAKKQEKILSYLCDIVETNSTKLWIYKGLILKQMISTDDIKMISTATSIVFNTKQLEKKLQLPNFKNEYNKSNESVNDNKAHTLEGVDISDLVEGVEVIQSLIDASN